MNSRQLIATGCGLSGLAVILGAFGAHALKSKIAAEMLQIFETGVRYQFYHSLALILTGILATRYDHPGIRTAGWFFVAGIVLFSGSLYLLSNREWMGIESWKSVLGPITPLGGLCFITGWALLTLNIVRSNPV